MYGILRVSTLPSGNILTFVWSCQETSWYSNKYSINVFNVCAIVSTDTKLCTRKISASDIEYFSGAWLIAWVGCALLVSYIDSPNTILVCLSRLKVWQPYAPLLFSSLALYFALQAMIFRTHYDGVQPKTYHFSTRDLIWANYKVVIQLSQLIFLSFKYFNIAPHNPVIGLCRELNICNFKLFYSKLTNIFVAINFWHFQ